MTSLKVTSEFFLVLGHILKKCPKVRKIIADGLECGAVQDFIIMQLQEGLA
jgi:hypothetical protein